jgi:glycosyltransferase involved in cell wall biosynthesis
MWDIEGTKRRVGSYFVDKIIVHGKATQRQALVAGYDSQKLEVVPHGLYNHFEKEHTDDVKENETQILFFGNIRKNKGYDRIPELMSKVRAEVPDARALVAGSFPEYTSDGTWEWDVLQQLKTHEAITIDNRYIPASDVARYFRESAVVALPYYNATSSGVLMTAYTFDTPVVVTDTGDIGQYVSEDNSGIVADENHTDDIATAIATLLRNHNLRENKARNLRRNKEKYAWKTIVERTVSIYQEVSINSTLE